MNSSETGAEGEGEESAGTHRACKGHELERSAVAAGFYCGRLGTASTEEKKLDRNCCCRCCCCLLLPLTHCIKALVRLVVCGRSETPSTF